MILIDTNVVSELTKPYPDANVADWIVAHHDRTLLSVFVIAEVRAGIATTKGRGKRNLLMSWFHRVMDDHAGRIVEFGTAGALRWGEMAGDMLVTGKRSGHMDSLIAAQALALGVPVATRNVWDFEETGVGIINPWAA